MLPLDCLPWSLKGRNLGLSSLVSSWTSRIVYGVLDVALFDCIQKLYFLLFTLIFVE